MSPIFSHVEPIFPVRDIPETIRYWQEVLGFTHHWTWGEPPSHGGVSWQKAFVQFLRHPDLAAASRGNAIWIRLRHIEELYALHQRNKAEIVAPLEMHAYGLAQYSVREINGYYVHFAGEPPGRRREETGGAGPETTGMRPGMSGTGQEMAGTGPETTDRTGSGKASSEVLIVERKPSVEEYKQLQASIWGSGEDDPIVVNVVATADLVVVAEDAVTGAVIGCALLLSDHAGFYCVKNVMVRRDWQGRGVGTALMKELMQRLESRITRPAMVGLFARESLEPFYQQFGFLSSFGMVKEI
ncbi:MAG TPA: GNAT family N-acetyltransferase [Puia sp.]|nr:GNAT family N-acetyltransferase [Puia sp.]